MHRSKYRRYSITSSARASSGLGTVRLSAFAVLSLIIDSQLDFRGLHDRIRSV